MIRHPAEGIVSNKPGPTVYGEKNNLYICDKAKMVKLRDQQTHDQKTTLQK